jgi:hypothetical protein
MVILETGGVSSGGPPPQEVLCLRPSKKVKNTGKNTDTVKTENKKKISTTTNLSLKKYNL